MRNIKNLSSIDDQDIYNGQLYLTFTRVYLNFRLLRLQKSLVPLPVGTTQTLILQTSKQQI